MAGLFEKFYGADEDAINADRKGLVKSKVTRGFDSAIDSLKDSLLDEQEKEKDLITDIANGDVGEISELVEVRMNIDEFGAQIKKLEEIKADFF